jgi:TRAP transporter TAXI family solute receptor
MKKLIYLSLLLLSLGALLVACGNDDEVTILTGGEQGVYFPIGGAMAQIITQHVDGVKATGVTSGASVVNSNDLNDGKAELALVQNDIAFYAHAGSHMFNQVTNNFLGIATLYPEVVQIVTAADSGIETVQDLVGKRVAVGAQGSGTEANARQILEVYGIQYNQLNVEFMNFGDAASGIQDRNIDAAFITSGTPTGAIEALKANRNVRIVTISPEKIDELTTKYPYYTRFDLSKDVYGTDSDATTVAVQAMLIVRRDMSDDRVYAITKAIFENTDVLANTHARGSNITKETALDGMSINVHPGAQRFFNDR